MDEKLFQENKHKIQREIKELSRFDDEIIPITEDGTCIFNAPDHTCAIYDSRPEVCKLYGTIPELKCPYVDHRGVARTPAKVRRIQRQNNKMEKMQLEAIRKMVESHG